MTTTDPVENLQALIRCPSVTPAEGGALSSLDAMLAPLGFRVERMLAQEPGTAAVQNLYARIGTDGPPHLFAGHREVGRAGRGAARQRNGGGAGGGSEGNDGGTR